MSYDSEVLADSPLGYWKLDEAAGATAAADSSGATGRALTVNGGVTSGAAAVAPMDASSYSFPALSSAYLIHAIDSSWIPQASFTFEAWFNANDVTSAGVLLSRDGTSTSVRGPNLFVNSGKLTFASGSGNKAGTTTLTPGTAYHVACTYDNATSTLKLYVNGALDATFTTTVPNSNDPLLAGVSYFGANLSSPFNGRMSHLAYYGTALSATRIQAHYAARTSASSQSVAAVPATATASTPAPTVAATQPNATVNAVAAAATASAATPTLGNTFDATVAATTATATGAAIAPSLSNGSGSAEVDAPPATANAAAPTPLLALAFGTTTDNLLNGRARGGTSIATVDPAVIAAPNTLEVVTPQEVAIPLPAPVMNDGRPTGAYANANTLALYKAGGRDRVLIGGVDITYFRGKPVPIPAYTLSEPFAYDASTLTIPQVNPIFETLGTGDLRWAHAGAKVVYQRVYDDGTKVTDYRGVVISLRAINGQLEVGIGGELSGRANLLNAQPPLFRKVKDVGWWAWVGSLQLGVHVTPRLGPVTGISIPAQGGMTTLAWLQQVCTMSQTRAGAQRSIMPTTWGGSSWAFDVKDSTTVDATIYLDGTYAVPDLTDDASEQPNVWYGTGVTPDGMRVRNGRYPGIIGGPAPTYPLAGGGSFGLGTKDSDTDTGSGVTVLQVKLLWQHYVEQADYTPGTYDTGTQTGVKRLQRDVGLTVTGDVDQATWSALFDLSATGYSLAGSSIHPMVWDARVEKWLYTSNGSIAKRNPAYDRRVLRVERNVDFEPGLTKPQMIDVLEGMYERTAAKNWTGTITLNGVGGFSGKHELGDTPAASDVMGPRDFRPGMNVWLPGFDGGTLVHVGGAQVNPGSGGAPDSVTLSVDTQARDLMELSQIIARNKESRRNIRREWNAANRTNKPSGNQITFDEYGGILAEDRQLVGGQWNVVPLIAGQTGQLERVDVLLDNAVTEFCLAVFSQRMTVKKLQRRIGDPFPVNSAGESVWQTKDVQPWFDDKTILYAAGDDQDPLGYGRRHKYGTMTDANGNPIPTGAPLTGRYRDDAGVPYKTPSNEVPLLWLAIYPRDNCTLEAGRLLYKLEDDAG